MNLLDDETIETTIDVDVDELCTITVANNPSIRPAIGLERIASSVNALPVILPKLKIQISISMIINYSPPTRRKAELMTSSEQTNI